MATDSCLSKDELLRFLARCSLDRKSLWSHHPRVVPELFYVSCPSQRVHDVWKWSTICEDEGVMKLEVAINQQSRHQDHVTKASISTLPFPSYSRAHGSGRCSIVVRYSLDNVQSLNYRCRPTPERRDLYSNVLLIHSAKQFL